MDNAAGLSKIFINLKTHASEYAVGEHTSLTERSSKTSGACAGELVDPVHASCAILAGIAFTLIDIYFQQEMLLITILVGYLYIF